MIQGYMILWLREGLKEQHLLELEIFCNNAKVFTVTFDQFNPSLLNKTFKAYYPQTFQWYIFSVITRLVTLNFNVHLSFKIFFMT